MEPVELAIWEALGHLLGKVDKAINAIVLNIYAINRVVNYSFPIYDVEASIAETLENCGNGSDETDDTAV